MISVKEFHKINDKCFEINGCKKINKNYIYEGHDVFIIFMIIKSNYSSCYYIDYNFVVKSIHSAVSIASLTVSDFDFILQPRLILHDGTTQLLLNNLTKESYEMNLKIDISNLIQRVERYGLVFIKELVKKEHYVVNQEVMKQLK